MGDAASQALLDLISNSFWVHPSETSALARDMICPRRSLAFRPRDRLVYELTASGFQAVEDLIASNAKVAVR